MPPAWRTIGILGVTQIVSWGALYYAFTITAPGIQRDLGIGPGIAFGAFSWSLLVAGMAATPAGMLIDRHGGRYAMAAGSLAAALGLAWLALCTTPAAYVGAWTVIGLAMSLTLYEAAFATINRKLQDRARQGISTLTLFGGFASTIAWPLTLYLVNLAGWREAYLCFAALQLGLCLPLHLLLGADAPRTARASDTAPRRHATLAEALRHPAFRKLALAFAGNVLVFSALAIHLIPLLQHLGHAAGAAVLMAALIGPMQVAGRIGEMTVGRHAPPRRVGVAVFAALPAALLTLLLFGSQAWAPALFCMIFGLGNGILTIVRGTVPQELFGREHYGAISGALAAPSLLAKAAGPLAAAAILRADGPLLLLALLLGCALASLLLYLSALRAHAAQPAAKLPPAAGKA
ncbi:MFS transporter [Massilia niastensis]|uniref:MFS transporter n=1 Tax=Massilia niastensis TaxID=544911 RepID=UPI0003649A3A|nr:MFS transporter [Massilia niastensis]